MADFEKAIGFVLENEGGYVNDPLDPGGETKYGITKRSYPTEDIAGLTLERAHFLYRRDYWRYDAITDQPVATKVLDLAVNAGAYAAHRILQNALCALGRPVIVDGNFGPVTLSAVNDSDPGRLMDELCAQTARFYRNLVEKRPSSAKFLKGWLARAARRPA